VAQVVTAVAVLTAVGCGEERTERTQRPERTDAAASPFCDASRQWAVHEMRPVDESDPKEVEAHFKDYGAFIDKSIATAPPAVADDWKVYGTAIQTVQLPVMKKFGFSFEEVNAKGTEAEKAIFDGAPNPRVDNAFKAILTYEANVCGSQGLPPADVSFEGEKAAAYCRLGGKIDELIGSAIGNGPSVAGVKKLLDGGQLWRLQERQVDAAPDAIRADVATHAEFDRTQHRRVIEKYDYDLPKLVLSGTAHDRAIFQRTDGSIREANSRVDAFDEQVCS
jgi:hypothetical protein